MTGQSRYTAQDIIDAYQRTGSVWRAGKELGLAGQSVHERLRAVGYPLAGRRWDEAEIAELRALVDHLVISDIAHRLGRTYAAVACKINELGIGSRTGNHRPVKIPRGAGYDKASCKRYAAQLDESGDLITRFARRQGLGIEMLVQALERHMPEWWEAYKATHSSIPERDCEYCGRTFVPASGKQRCCSRKCSAARRTDESYFGGKRRNTIGLAEGRCQLCARTNVKALSSHHVLGKDNDPDNDFLIALCSGCHQLVTLLAGRPFLEHGEGWEALIQLALLRRYGPDPAVAGIGSYVDIELLTPEEVEEEDAYEEDPAQAVPYPTTVAGAGLLRSPQ